MGFKADLSFLEKVTMGATATRAALAFLTARGFSPVELERYSTSNKIWSTKVKRLRLPDILCVRTGMRVEVRGKSDLKIKMSDSPSNPDRTWDAGLRDEDLVALVACAQAGGEVRVLGTPVFLGVGAMRASVGTSTLGPPKSASEGAERDRTWPSVVPSADGEVSEVDGDRIRVVMNGRRQTYSLSRVPRKFAYVRPGDRFVGEASIIAGTVPTLADLTPYQTRVWNPLDDLDAARANDRYAAAKALGARPDVREGRAALERRVQVEEDDRTALEVVAALARLGSDDGLERLKQAVVSPPESAPDYLRMEAVLILTELKSAGAAQVLAEVATAPQFMGNELRQAAVWGLGKLGCKSYDRLTRFLGDEEDDVTMHAIAAFGPDTDRRVVDQLVGVLVGDLDERSKASASEALRLIGSEHVVAALAAAASQPWVLATLGRLPAAKLNAVRLAPEITVALSPIHKLSEETNWLARRLTATDFQFLIQQNL